MFQSLMALFPQTNLPLVIKQESYDFPSGLYDDDDFEYNEHLLSQDDLIKTEGFELHDPEFDENEKDTSMDSGKF